VASLEANGQRSKASVSRGRFSEALWFAEFGLHQSVDVWSVDARGLAVLESMDGFVYYSGSIGPDRVRLVEADLSAADATRRQTETSGS
jgi:hypothetical protein